MRIARIDHDGAPVAAIVDEDAVRPLPGVAVLDLLAATPAERERLAGGATEELALADVRLLSPIRPASVRDFSVFERHSEGAVMLFGGPDAKVQEAWYETPAFYFSNPHATTGPGDVIEPPAGATGLDLELEVAVVIGRPGRNLAPHEAGAHIAGYTIFNDWSERDIAGRELRMPLGFHKAKDFANTFGPWIVTADELEERRRGDRLDLEMVAAINGVELGRDTLANMAWSFEELVAFASRGAWVGAGDVMGSGTCGGGCLMEAWGRKQAREPAPLRPGDVIRLEVEGIGTLTNTVGEPQPALDPLPRARTRVGA
jgi:2-keto-4-pentenoate hydratase/2-oxohepta-3-ene-1,7-dioic acid hydratase in catechol pathway